MPMGRVYTPSPLGNETGFDFLAAEQRLPGNGILDPALTFIS